MRSADAGEAKRTNAKKEEKNTIEKSNSERSKK